MKEPFVHPLKHPLVLPHQTLNELRFPAMKGTYMRKFTMTVQRETSEARRAEDAAVAEVGIEMSYGRYMVLAEAMLADEYGLVTARLILDEMDPEDVHEMVSRVGERFAGGPTTGTPSGQFHWPPSELDDLDPGCAGVLDRAREWTQWQKNSLSPS